MGLAARGRFTRRPDQPARGAFGNLPWPFLFAPVPTGAALPTAFAFIWHRWVCRPPRPEQRL
jgi:hypothetical protein